MYFMDDKALRNIERLMRGVPNFKPRGHGLVVICRINYEPVDETLAELLLWTFQNVRNPIFRRRLERYIAECEDYDMRFKNEYHRRAFDEIIRKKDIKNRELMSALYLLTADKQLSNIVKRCCDGNRISFKDMKLNGCSEEAYTLYCVAKDIYAEQFCSEKCAIFVIMPEENPNTFFMISLIIQQMYREILAVADENGGKLENRCIFFCDEFGTLPKIESAEMMFSASRSRRLQIVPIIQSFAQLEKNYGKEGAEIIVDNTQLTICGGFAPNSSSADVISKAMGSRTVLSGSVSRSKNDPSQSLQMIERPLMTPDELKSLPKGKFIVMKTGAHPMQVKLKLFFDWGIEFEKGKEYELQGHENRKVEYAEKKEIMDGIVKKYHQDWLLPPQKSQAGADTGGQSQIESESNEPHQTQAVVNDEKKDKSCKSGGRGLKTTAPINRGKAPEVNPSEQT